MDITTFVNGKRYRTYPVDTVTSIKHRIALQAGVIPERIRYKITEIADRREVEWKTMDVVMRDYAPEQLQLFYDVHKSDFPEYTLENMACAWYVSHQLKTKSNPYIDITLRDYLSQQKINYDMIPTSTLDYFQSSQRDKYNTFARSAQYDQSRIELFTSDLKTIHATPLEIVKVKTELQFTVGYDVYELFNSLQMSRDLPFAVVGNYYKILKEFVPVDSWTLSNERAQSDFGGDEDVLYLKLLNVANEPPQNRYKTNPNLYSTVAIWFRPPESSDKNSNKVSVRFETNLDSEFTESQLISRLLHNFPGAVSIESQRQIGVKAEFLIPKYTVDRPIFQHAVLNDPLFSRNLYIDDKTLRGQKGGIYVYYVPDPLNPEPASVIAFSITEQIVERTSLKVIAQDPLLRPDTPYLRVRITRAVNSDTALSFYNVWLRLLSRYERVKDDISQLYSRYITDFTTRLADMREQIETKRKKSSRKREMLKDIDPDQFISGYSRWLCPAKRAPKIIATREGDVDPPNVVTLQERDVQTMLFPKVPVEAGVQYKQYYYSCDHHTTDRFPGLRVNRLENSDKYPIVPCCYKKDHRSKAKSIWRQYYEEGKTFSDFKTVEADEDDDSVEGESHVYKTNKILPYRRIGRLYQQINTFFSTLDIDSQYFRIGVSRSPNSAIECLLMALDPDYDAYDSHERLHEITSIRNRMTGLLQKSGVYQSAYTFTEETLKEYLLDSQRYIDPTVFHVLLEEVFRCNIYTFTVDESNPMGILECPKFIKRYLEAPRRKGRYVFLYQHSGVDIDRAVYPQCELITRIKGAERDYSFSESEKIVKRTVSAFNAMYKTSETESDIVVGFNTEMVSQHIDYYGKCRALWFRDGIVMYTNPVPPLNLPQSKISDVKPCSLTRAREFLRREGCSENLRIVNGALVGVYSQRGKVEFYIPVVPREYEDVSTSRQVIAPTFVYDKSEMEVYNSFHKLARYLTEYLFYMFSHFYHRVSPPVVDDEFIATFIAQCVEIRQDWVYPQITRLFSLDCPLLYNQKLVVHNTDVLKRLVYVLRLKLHTDKDGLLNYRDYSYIRQYYSDIRDFSHSSTQSIIYGQDALQKWIENHRQDYRLYDSIRVQGLSLYSELSKYGVERPFMLIFGAGWNKPTKALLSKIFKRPTDSKYNSMWETYHDRLQFVYIDIDKNRDLASSYDVSSVPYIYFIRLRDETVDELGRVRCGDNIYENIKRITAEIKRVV
jgi:hypothetical protein